MRAQKRVPVLVNLQTYCFWVAIVLLFCGDFFSRLGWLFSFLSAFYFTLSCQRFPYKLAVMVLRLDNQLWFFTFYLVFLKNFCGPFAIFKVDPQIASIDYKKVYPCRREQCAQQHSAQPEAIAGRVQHLPTLVQSIVATFKQQSAQPQGNLATVQQHPASYLNDNRSIFVMLQT